MGKNIPTMTKS